MEFCQSEKVGTLKDVMILFTEFIHIVQLRTEFPWSLLSTVNAVNSKNLSKSVVRESKSI